jgi:hypothetical protein
MNRFAIFLVLSFGLVGIASAESAFRYITPDRENTRVNAGEVGIDGTIIHGSGFTATHVSAGTYDITFDRNQFKGNCPVMVANSEVYDNVASVTRLSCRRRFQVLLSHDAPFMFIARDTDQ